MKEVVILGATGGIGKAIVKAMAEPSTRLWLHYNKGVEAKTELSQWLDEKGIVYEWYCSDFATHSAVGLFFSHLDGTCEGIDVFINAIGTSKHNLFQWMSAADWESLRHINLDVFVYAAQEALKRMFGRPDANMVMISSVWGQVGSSMEVQYSVVKAGVIGLIKALAKEVGPAGIRINGVAPGWIETKMNQDFSPEEKSAFEEEVPLGRIGRPEEVASCVRFLASRESSYLTGQILNPNGGFYI